MWVLRGCISGDVGEGIRKEVGWLKGRTDDCLRQRCVPAERMGG